MSDFSFRTLIQARAVSDSKGNEFPLHSETSLEQCEFLQNLIRVTSASKCLEVGLAYGISSLAVCEAMSESEGGALISIDPFQEAHWRNIGLSNLERAGYREMVHFHAGFAEDVLPRLSDAGTVIDLAYVDGNKMFDRCLVQAHFLIKMLRIGGVLVFDDCGFPGLARAMRWLSGLPCLEVHATMGPLPISRQKRLAGAIAGAIPFGARLLRPELVRAERSRRTAFHCVAFRKVCEDERRYDWDDEL